MKFKAPIAALVIPGLLCGCASYSVGVRSGGAPSSPSRTLAPGSSYSAVSIQAQGNPNPYVGVIFLAPILFGANDDYRRLGARPSSRKAPDMSEGRAIAERDCSRPLGPIEANLRCK